VAVVIDTCRPYQNRIVERIRNRLRAAGYGTLCVTARSPGAHDTVEGRGSPGLIDPLVYAFETRGSILLSTVLGQGFAAVDLERCVDRLGRGGRPVVSLGEALSGVPSVTLDSTGALRELMVHMTRDPARRRFVFLRGHPGDRDSREREEVFRRVLAEKGIAVDERLMIDGHYTSADAYMSFDALLRTGERIDAVVAANDDMAASAMTALRRHGFCVPDDVIVSGFDDDPLAAELQPPLTTVRGSIGRQAEVAAELLLESLEVDAGPRFHPRVTLDAEFVPRASSLPAAKPGSVSGPLERALISNRPREELRALLYERLVALQAPAEVNVLSLAEAFIGVLFDGDGSLADDLANQLTAPGDGAGDAAVHDWWRHASRQLAQVLERLPKELTRAKPLPRLARALDTLSGAQHASSTAVRFERRAHRQLHEQLLLRLAGCSTQEAIWSLLRDGFRALGVERAWVTLYDESRDCTVSGAYLAFELDGATIVSEGEPFALADVLPSRLAAELERGALVLNPLGVRELSLGYLLLDPGELASLELSAIAASVALALRNVRQLADLERRAEALHLANDRLSLVARHDTLTGLANRSQFHENLETAFAVSRREGWEASLLFLDLDGFKLINDTLGHSAGDELLRIVAARIGGVLREGDSLARLGGDEFTIIVAEGGEGAEGAAGQRVAEDVLATIARPFRLGEHVVNVTTSIGIARFPGDGEDAETLMRNADMAMYHAKACGKCRYSPYTAALDRRARAELELREAMREGLEAGEFHLHYQPRVVLADGRLSGFEALLRWQRPQAGARVVGPVEFVPVAERCGLIASLDAFSLDAACAQASVWAKAGFETVMSVNLSVRRLQEPSIVAQVAETLRRHELEPRLLELEVTESAAMSDVEASIEKLGALRALGVRIAIDDFGTGYSSLSYLRRLPVTSLKVDRSFLSGIESTADTGSAEAAIVQAVVALGRSLGFRVVAEGVENEAQVAFLRRLGCDEGQGYHFERPLDAGAAHACLCGDGRIAAPLRGDAGSNPASGESPFVGASSNRYAAPAGA